jgi:hypothetical protein
MTSEFGDDTKNVGVTSAEVSGKPMIPLLAQEGWPKAGVVGQVRN